MPHNDDEKKPEKQQPKITPDDLAQFYTVIVNASQQKNHPFLSMLKMVKEKFIDLLKKPSDQSLASILQSQINILITKNFFDSPEMQIIAINVKDNIKNINSLLSLDDRSILVNKLHDIGISQIDNNVNFQPIPMKSGTGVPILNNVRNAEAKEKHLKQANNQIVRDQVKKISHQANIYIQEHKWDQAIKTFKECIDYLEQIDESSKIQSDEVEMQKMTTWLNFAKYNKAIMYTNQKKFNEAISLYRDILSTYHQMPLALRSDRFHTDLAGINLGFATTLNITAKECYNHGDINTALTYANESNQILENQNETQNNPNFRTLFYGNLRVMINATSDLGLTHFYADRTQEATFDFRHAIEMISKIPASAQTIQDKKINIRLHQLIHECLIKETEEYANAMDLVNFERCLKAQSAIMTTVKLLIEEVKKLEANTMSSSAQESKDEIKQAPSSEQKNRNFPGMRPKKRTQDDTDPSAVPDPKNSRQNK